MITESAPCLNRIDVYVGRRLKYRRSAMRLSIDTLSCRAGLSPEQLIRFEEGVEQISPLGIFQLSHVLEVPIAYFYSVQKNGAVV